MMKKTFVIGLILTASLMLVAGPVALAWQEGPSIDWWYIDPSYGDYQDSVPLIIELDGNSSAGQVFYVGDMVEITVDLYAVAQSFGGDGNGAFTEWLLEVDGPSGFSSVGDYNYTDSSLGAVADEQMTLNITYSLSAPGMHTVYASSYAAVSQYWADVADEFIEASLTFEVVAGPVALAWQEGPSIDWWYIDPSYGDYQDSVPLIIELDGNSSAGQVFYVGDMVEITVDLYPYAVSASGGADGAYAEWLLEVSGPTGISSDTDFAYDHDPGDDPIIGHAEVGAAMTLSITYLLTDPGIHTVYANSYVAVSQYYNDVANETVDASLIFEVVVETKAVVVETKADVLKGNGVPGKGIDNAPGLQKEIPNDNFAKGIAEETVDASLIFEVVVETKADVLKGNGVPGKGIDNAPGLQKEIPNDNFAKGKNK